MLPHAILVDFIIKGDPLFATLEFFSIADYFCIASLSKIHFNVSSLFADKKKLRFSLLKKMDNGPTNCH